MTISSVAPAIQPGTTDPAAGAAGAAGLGALFAGILQAGTALGVPVSIPTPTGCTDTVGDGPTGDAETSGSSSTSSSEGSAGPELSPGTNPAGIAEILSAAQIMAAAQVVPVTPVLAATLALQSGTPTASGAPVGSTTAAPASPAAPAAPGAHAAPATSVAAAAAPTTAPTDVPGGTPPGTPTGSTAVSAGDLVMPAVPSSAVPLAAPTATEQAGNAVVTEQTGESTTEPVTAALPERMGTDVSPTRQQDGAAPGAVHPTATGTTQHHDSRPDHGPAARHQTEAAAPVNGPTGAQAGTPSTQAAAPATAPTHTAARQDAAPAAQVTGQVFPEVGRLVTRGDGTRRITLKLAPEALGEVRVVLTVRDGDVQVRMVGSEQAQQALRAGAPELQRLLDLAGASSSQIIVGDQGSGPDAGQHSGAGTDRDREDHRTAGTRAGDTSARDGFPGGPQSRPSTDPTAIRGAHTRTLAGVDVTM